MNLLPKSHQDFSQKEYWNTFFSKRGKKAFEWFVKVLNIIENKIVRCSYLTGTANILNYVDIYTNI